MHIELSSSFSGRGVFGRFVENDGSKVLAITNGETKNVRVVQTGTRVEMVEHDVVRKREHGRIVSDGLRVEEGTLKMRRKFDGRCALLRL